ncbi:peptide chain release factor N(5)-glutamine methyltransferase [Jatrophihabitans sp.]|uniref:peptide chain release factor N(5)-glutamine methyltransferase n=1 Tax=Jatrophihabitans sp. TaxID=1932789 RepID=UPI002BBB84C7|nr:peptide chain release factor N(5)-glutamine methyltransferase [Jatrophihabitans sp.]
MQPQAHTELAAATAQLSAAGVGPARVEAELLLAFVLGRGRSGLLAGPTVSPEQAARFRGLVGRRATGVPLQHLTGSAPFRHLELAVGPGVFIPRPETELLVELAAGWLLPGATVVDLCAGSGAVALAVANEFAPARVIAVERSEPALRWLRRNAADRQAAGDRPVEVVAGDISDPKLLADLTGTVAAVLANPPYVAESLRDRLPPEVASDPDEALFAGPDGLALMSALIALAGRLLRPGGLLGIEHAEDQTPALHELLAAAGDWDRVAGRPDLTGRPRFSLAIRR